MNPTESFLTSQYGSTQGAAWILTKSGDVATPTRFMWPSEKDEMVRAIAMANYEGDVWYAAHLMELDATGRHKGKSVERTKIHADIDRDLTTEDRQKIAQLGAWTVLSGSEGHAHVYVELDRNVTVDEYEMLSEALVLHLNADRSKIRDNDLLRIPGTDNHKPAGGPVTIDRPYEKAKTWSVEELRRILPMAALREKAVAVTSGAIVPEGIDILPGNVACSLDRLTGNRSEDTYAVVCECAKAGLTIEQAAFVVLSVPSLKQRADEKGQQFMTNELHRIWGKAVKKASTIVTYADNDFSDLIPGWTPPATETARSANPNILSAEKPPAPSEFKVRTASQMTKPRKMKWLAEGRIPESATTILVGHESIGKSLFWVHLVSIITTGTAAPHLGIAGGAKRHVMVVLNEDDFATAVLPRLIAAGADLNYVHPVCGDDEGNFSPTFPDAGAMQIIHDGVQEYEVALVVIDTWMNTLKGIDIKDPVKARNALQPWTTLAQSLKTSVLLVTHTNRLNTKSTRDAMGGTSELRKAARSTLFAQLDDQKRLTVGVDKSNVAAATHAAIFEREIVELTYDDGDTDTMPLLKYVGDADQTAQEILETSVDSSDEMAVDKKDCGDWLLDILQKNGGSMLSKDLDFAGDAAGFSKQMVGRARRKLLPPPIKGPDGKWIASL